MSKGFNAYVEQQKECRDLFHNADQPITYAQLAAKGQLHAGQTGLFCEKYLQWKRRDIALKTWTEFKTFGNQEFSDYKRLSIVSSKEAGYVANKLLQRNPNIHKLEEAIDNLAFAATT
eukprot:15336491-Ditylum_brightwellii.AAC.1